MHAGEAGLHLVVDYDDVCSHVFIDPFFNIDLIFDLVSLIEEQVLEVDLQLAAARNAEHERPGPLVGAKCNPAGFR